MCNHQPQETFSSSTFHSLSWFISQVWKSYSNKSPTEVKNQCINSVTHQGKHSESKSLRKMIEGEGCWGLEEATMKKNHTILKLVFKSMKV